MAQVVDRFNILSERIRRGFSRNRIKRIVQEESEPLQLSLLRRLRALAPKGDRWEDPADVFEHRRKFPEQVSPRPSLRQHGITLDQGWLLPRLDFIGSTGNTIRASISVENTAPHIRYIVNGTDKPALIHRSDFTGNERLFFHWVRRNVTVWPLAVQNHPGTRANNFPERAIDQTQSDVEDFNARLFQRIGEGFNG